METCCSLPVRPNELVKGSEIFDREELTAALDHSYANRVHIAVKNIGTVMRRLHELSVDELGMRTLGDVFRNPTEVSACLFHAKQEAGLSLEFVLCCTMLGHHGSMAACGCS